MRLPGWMGLWVTALAMLAGCAGNVPPKPPPSPTVDLTAHNATRAVVTDVEPSSGAAAEGASALILPDATDVVVVEVERMIELELNPLLLMMAQRYVEGDCLLANALGVERVIVSRGPNGWVAAVEGDDIAKRVITCLEGEGPVGERTFRGQPAVELGFGLTGVSRDGVLLVGEEGPLGRLLGPRGSSRSAELLALLPDRADSLLEVGSRSDIDGAPAASSGYVAGTLDRMQLHAESTVKDDKVAQLLKLLPVMKVALRPALEKMLGSGPEAEVVMKLIDELEVEHDGDRVILDLEIEDVRGLIDTLAPQIGQP